MFICKKHDLYCDIVHNVTYGCDISHIFILYHVANKEINK